MQYVDGHERSPAPALDENAGAGLAPLFATALTQGLGIRHPVLLAPMAGVGGGLLASAVSRAGGFGFIGAGYEDSGWLQEQLRLAGETPVGVGFIGWALERNPQMLWAALDRETPVVLLSFGSLAPHAARIHHAGALLIAQVQAVQQARQAWEEGAGLLVVQGSEAGGHVGTRATLPLVPAVIDAVPGIPVVAAGGIADGRGLTAALALGAAGAMCGTAFYASDESLAHPLAKRRVVTGNGDATIRSTVFDRARGLDWPSDWQLRSLSNDFSHEWAKDVAGLEQQLPVQQERYAAAREAGDFDIAAVVAGEAVDLVRHEAPAALILERMVEGAAAELRRLNGLMLAGP